MAERSPTRQLYPVRASLTADLRGTLERTAAIGFENVELYRFEQYRNEYHPAFAATGPHPVSAQADLIGGDARAAVETALDEDVVLGFDLFWAEVGGASAVGLVSEFGDRVRLLHVKDGRTAPPWSARRRQARARCRSGRSSKPWRRARGTARRSAGERVPRGPWCHRHGCHQHVLPMHSAPEELPSICVTWARGMGVLDLARADVPERASGTLAHHVLDVLLGIQD